VGHNESSNAFGTMNYYQLLGLKPTASPDQIRHRYRELSRDFHPDTSSLPPAIAVVKFQEINQAYATLSSPQKRILYDQSLGYANVAVVTPLPPLYQKPSGRSVSTDQPVYSSRAYLDPNDRPLSGGELFALVMMAVTLLGCLLLALIVGLSRGDAGIKPGLAEEMGLVPELSSARLEVPPLAKPDESAQRQYPPVQPSPAIN
jgi:hypothetical protein